MTQKKELGIETGCSDISDSDLGDLVQYQCVTGHCEEKRAKTMSSTSAKCLMAYQWSSKVILWGIVIHGAADGYSQKDRQFGP